MRKIIIVFAFALALTSCTGEKKAQKLIKQYLQETLNDWKSYESIKYGSLDSCFTIVYDDSAYTSAMLKHLQFVDEYKLNVDKMDTYIYDRSSFGNQQFNEAKEISGRLIDSIDIYKKVIDSIETNFASTFKGWSMTHIFRANNAVGAKIINGIKFYFNPEISAIINTEEIKEEN